MSSVSPELSVADRLENEIADLKDQVDSLRKQLKLQTTTILSAESTRDILQDRLSKDKTDASSSKLLSQSDKQAAHDQQRLYRACASVTTFKIRDPDPNAVDRCNVLGIRLDVMTKARFVRPYYVMLNRPYSSSRHLRVHRHTVPPSIPLPGLAARYLPPPRPSEDEDEGGVATQDLSRFARALRRELVRFHNRSAVVGDMRKAAELGRENRGRSGEEDVAIADISAVDAEAKQIRIEWGDGRTGRLVMGDDGEIQKMVVQGEDGRDRRTVRELFGGSVRVEELVGRLGGS